MSSEAYGGSRLPGENAGADVIGAPAATVRRAVRSRVRSSGRLELGPCWTRGGILDPLTARRPERDVVMLRDNDHERGTWAPAG